MNIAIVGSGPAAAGALLGCIKHAHVSAVSIFDAGSLSPTAHEPALTGLSPEEWPPATVARLHQIIGARSGALPEKSHFGYIPHFYPHTRVYRSALGGGLSRLWGAGMLPFRDSDIADWPIGPAELDSRYRALLGELPITGGEGKLSTVFPSEFTNQPPIPLPQVLDNLLSHVNRADSFFAGPSRLAVRLSGPRACTMCDHCFYGCYQNAIYCAADTVRKYLSHPNVQYHPGCTVTHVRRTATSAELIWSEPPGNPSSHCFDRIFLAAGCIETTRIVARSMGLLGHSFPLLENPVIAIPLLYFGPHREAARGNRLSLSNVIIGFRQASDPHEYIHGQVYHVNPYMLRHIALRIGGPSHLHWISRLAEACTDGRAFIVLAYLPGRYSQGSTLMVSDSSERISFLASPTAQGAQALYIDGLRAALRGSGFHIITPLVHRLPPGTSIHYAGALSALDLGRAGAVQPNIYACDSSTFPSIPAQNHSYTIMANAMRIADEALSSSG